MAAVGLRKLLYAILKTDTADADTTYGDVKIFGKAIESSFNPSLAEAELYADDVLSESAAEFSKGDLTLGVSDDDDTVFAEVLGKKIKEVKIGEITVKEVISAGNDAPPWVGIAQIVPKMVNGVKKYKAEILLKVKFKPYQQTAKTKGSSLEFTTPSVTGVVTLTEGGNYKRHATCATEDEALAYIAHVFGSTAEKIKALYATADKETEPAAQNQATE